MFYLWAFVFIGLGFWEIFFSYGEVFGADLKELRVDFFFSFQVVRILRMGNCVES